MTLPPRSEMLLCCSVYRMSCHELVLDAGSRAAVSEVAGCVLLPLSERRYCDYRQRCVATVGLGRIYGNVDNDQLLPSSRHGIPPSARSVWPMCQVCVEPPIPLGWRVPKGGCSLVVSADMRGIGAVVAMKTTYVGVVVGAGVVPGKHYGPLQYTAVPIIPYAYCTCVLSRVKISPHGNRFHRALPLAATDEQNMLSDKAEILAFRFRGL